MFSFQPLSGVGRCTLIRMPFFSLLLEFFMFTRLFAFLGLSALPVLAFADMSTDVTASIAQFAAVNTAIPVVGGAFLLALGILAAWKLIRGAFA